jgi:hypothetical protein
MDAVRLSIARADGQLTLALGEQRASVAYDEERVAGAARQLRAAVERGTRRRAEAQASLADMRTLGEELYRALFPPAIRDELADLEQRPLLLEIEDPLAALPWELVFDGRAFLCRRFDVARGRPGPYALERAVDVDAAQAASFQRAVDAELRRGRAVGAAVRRAREALVAAGGEAALGWAAFVLHGDPSWVLPLGAAPHAEGRVPMPAKRWLVGLVVVMVATIVLWWLWH